ncbi:MAG: hypothetical protein K8L97_15345 [Anaerolineae bacterium]|nr:hypothetical protein [Anaerolineae bacterium]
MGIRLDWEIEAEQSKMQRAGEDPILARQRRLARVRFLLFVLVIVTIFGGIVALVFWRLRTVDAEIEQALRNTVDAEVAALRIGDYNAFAVVQRSASDEWLRAQQSLFNEYQDLKTRQAVQLTGQILDVNIDNTRARVEVQEILDGVPYSRIWFYWRYDDGWHHVPPDYTFWGDLKTAEAQNVSVRYQTVDDTLAQDASAKLSGWLSLACAALNCTPPELSVEIVPDETLLPSWSAGNPWLLQLPSPYVHRARSDMPFDLNLQFAIASLLAERLVASTSNNLQPTYPADAYYLRQAVVSWLVGRFVQVDTNAFIINTLAANYGDAAVGRLVAALQPDSSVAVLGQITGAASLDQINLDWRDFLTWRMVTEDDLIRRNDEANFTAFYDTRDENARNLAYQRFREGAPPLSKVVITAAPEMGADGIPLIRAVMQVGETESANLQEVLFRLADGVWKRLN